MIEEVAVGQKSLLEYRHYDLPNDLPVKVVGEEAPIADYSCGHKRHFHNHLEIGYCFYGSGNVFIENAKKPYKKGTFTFIPRNMAHGTQSDEYSNSKWAFLFIDIEGIVETFGSPYVEKIRHAMDVIESNAYVLNEDENAEMAFYIRKVLDHLKNDQYNRGISCRSILLAFIVEVCNLHHRDIEASASTDHIGHLRLRPALDHVDAYYNAEIKVSDLSELCHVSESHFRRLFIGSMKASPHEYINKVRIQKACDMLSETDDTVLNVAMKTGFPSITTFNRNFTKLLGTTPLKWRKNS